MWSETVSLRTRLVSDQKKSVLVLQVCCYVVVEHGLVTLVVIMILKDTAIFQVLLIKKNSFAILCLEHHSWRLADINVLAHTFHAYNL